MINRSLEKLLRSEEKESTKLLTANDELPFYGKDPEPGVILGVYGVEDWAKGEYVRKRHLMELPTVVDKVTFLTKSSFSLIKLVTSMGKRYTFFGEHTAMVIEKDVQIRIFKSRGKIDVELTGSPESVEHWINWFDDKFERAESQIEWVYSTNGHSISVPLNFTPAIQSAYPWIDGTIDEFVQDYLNSPASVLVLIGPPGTGKTTLIKNLIHASGGDAVVAFDEKVMNDDRLFADFIDGDASFLVMEDADAFLQARKEGNTMMHKFLNLSDGLVSARDKKLIFSTNLPSTSDIDAALIRAGRCFAVLEFRKLTREEAQKVIDETGSGSLPADKNEITLAELLVPQSGTGVNKRKIGFI